MGKGKKRAASDSQLGHSTDDKAVPKQDRKQAAAPAQPAAAAAADNKPSKKLAAKDEIDAIFSTAKKSTGGEAKPQEQLTPELQQLAQEVNAARQAAQASGKRPKLEGSKDDIFGEATGKGRKRTEEGYAVYTEDELGLGKRGGDTALCPFDCDCCF